MNKLFGFLKMKKEQRLMRSFDRLLSKIKKSDVAWYPDHCLGIDDLEYQLSNAEMRVNDLMLEIWELKMAKNELKRLKLELNNYAPY